jgi:two-component system CheB/CheR fusion protein
MLMISNSKEISIAVNAMKAGVSDFIEQPFSRHEVLHIVAQVLEHSLDANNKMAWTPNATHCTDSLTLRQYQVTPIALAASYKTSAKSTFRGKPSKE